MNNNEFNPEDVGVANGNYFGFPNNPDSSDIVLLNVPWDVTTSYRPGTSQGPNAIIEASVQLDFFDFEVEKAWETKIGSVLPDGRIEEWNKILRPKAEQIIVALESGAELDFGLSAMQKSINDHCSAVNEIVKQTSLHYLYKSSIVGVVGGDHSSPLGLIEALSEIHRSFGILHIDAHADLRLSYEGFLYSHASIMNNALKCSGVQKLVQVAVRDVSVSEIVLAKEDSRIVMFTDHDLKENEFQGIPWHQQCLNIINELPEKVYISFDIDGLMPELCPNTGTPVAGGLSYNQALYLLHVLKRSGRQIIGFDLCEVSPGVGSDWDANVGARILYKLAVLAGKR